jgi:uncharacterized membrane protein
MATMLEFVTLVAIASHLAPYATRRDVFFGVTVSAGFRSGTAGRSISRRYAAEVWFLALVAAAFVATSPMPQISGPMLLAQTIGATVAFVHARRAVLPHAAAPVMVREAVIGGDRPHLPGGLVGQLGPFLILVVAAAYLGLHWEEIPARFPTHWNLAGKPDGWTTKSVAGVFRGPLIGLFACSMTLFTSFAVLRWTRLPRVTGREGQQSRRVRYVNLIAMLGSEYMIALVLSWASIASKFSSDPRQLRLPLVFRVAPFALIIVGTLAIRVMRREAAAGAAAIGDTTPDSSWFAGRLYFNRADPALFVEKRMGLGYTLNFGNPVSWLVVSVAATMILIALSVVP